MVRHRQEADVDLPFLDAANAIDCRFHIVIDHPRRHAAEDPEAVHLNERQHWFLEHIVDGDRCGVRKPTAIRF